MGIIPITYIMDWMRILFGRKQIKIFNKFVNAPILATLDQTQLDRAVERHTNVKNKVRKFCNWILRSDYVLYRQLTFHWWFQAVFRCHLTYLMRTSHIFSMVERSFSSHYLNSKVIKKITDFVIFFLKSTF